MKILYISTSYNFSKGVNANRVYDFIKYFTQEKFEITHLTPVKPFKVDHVKELIIPYSITKVEPFLFQYIRGLLSYKSSIQNEKWVLDIINFIDDHQKEFEKFDIVFINTYPVCLIRLAQYFKRKFNTKIVVDFQDPFAYDNYPLWMPFLFIPAVEYEKKLLKYVDLLILITPSNYKIYKKHYPRIKMLYIPTAIPSYIPKPIKRLSDPSKAINIVYGGSLGGSRVIYPLLDALNMIKKRTYFIRVIGNFSILTRAKHYKYRQIIWQKSISRSDYLDYFNKEGDIGVVVQSFKSRPTGTSGIGAKTYEYLSLNKPIIYIGPKGDNANLIKEYSNNFCIVTDLKKDLLKLKDYIEGFQNLSENTKKIYYVNYQQHKIYHKLTDTFKILKRGKKKI